MGACGLSTNDWYTQGLGVSCAGPQRRVPQDGLGALLPHVELNGSARDSAGRHQSVGSSSGTSTPETGGTGRNVKPVRPESTARTNAQTVVCSYTHWRLAGECFKSGHCSFYEWGRRDSAVRKEKFKWFIGVLLEATARNPFAWEALVSETGRCLFCVRTASLGYPGQQGPTLQ